MKFSCRRMLAVVLAVVGLAACQTPLKTQLPTGAAGYQAINATAQPVAPQGPYLLRPGDHLAVNVYQEPELTVADVPVDEAGMISLPLVGEVHVAGRSAADVSTQIQHDYGARFLRNPQVNVRLFRAATQTISVEGQVARPGQFEIQPGTTLLGAIAVAGSPTETARLDQVLVFRTINGQRLGARFNLTDIRAGRAADPQILPGDVIVIGYSSLRGVYRGILQAAPLVGIFTIF